MEKVRSFFESSIKGEYRIMAIAEGYVMLRKKGCVPFVESKKDIVKWMETSWQNQLKILGTTNVTNKENNL